MTYMYMYVLAVTFNVLRLSPTFRFCRQVYVYWNGNQVCTEDRIDRSIFGVVQVWLSDPWYVFL
jgi:hypothetical protein